jgi:predicted RNase H-like HicB family nuclease
MIAMIDFPYSLVIEATDEPDYFGFFSLELEGFSGIGHSVEDCLYQARWAMKEHLELLAEQQLPIPPRNTDPEVTIRNERKESQPKLDRTESEPVIGRD